MIIVLLLHMMGGDGGGGWEGWRGWGWLIYVRVWLGGQGLGIVGFLIFVFFVCCC